MRYAIHNGIRIHYEVEGRGVPLVLHPGFVGSVEDWHDAGYVAALKDQYRLVLIDPRGQGQSDMPHEPAAYAAHHRVGDVLAILDAEGIERTHFWGYSLGGWVGSLLGVAAPDRLRSLIIGASHPFGGHPRPSESDAFLEGLRRGMAVLVHDWEASVPDFWLSPGERQRWLAADPEALAAARLQRLTEPDLSRESIAAIRISALLYAGTRDEPAAVEHAARAMSNAEFVSLEGLDHAQTLARSDLIMPSVLAFLARVDGTTNPRP